MRTGRLLGGVIALALLLGGRPSLAQPLVVPMPSTQTQPQAQSQADDDAADAPAASETPAKSKPVPKRTAPKSAAKPAPLAPAPKAAAPPMPVANAPASTASGKPPITAADVRPPANMQIDCAGASKDAVIKLPDELARWATVYCTKLGNILNANDRHFGAFPDSGLRASFSAADMAGKTGEPGNDAYFTKIAYRELPPGERDALIALDPSVKRVLVGKSLWRLDLTAVGGASLSFLAIDPSSEMFWVFPLNQKGLGQPAFYVTSLEALNRAR